MPMYYNSFVYTLVHALATIPYCVFPVVATHQVFEEFDQIISNEHSSTVTLSLITIGY